MQIPLWKGNRNTGVAKSLVNLFVQQGCHIPIMPEVDYWVIGVPSSPQE
jgi:hypothetical protein